MSTLISIAESLTFVHFLYVCERGDLLSAKYIYSKIKSDSYNKALIISCKSGNVELVKWIYETIIDKDRIDEKTYIQSFYNACQSRNIEMISFIYELRMNSTSFLNSIFPSAIASNDLEIVIWVYNKCKEHGISIDFNEDTGDMSLLAIACQSGNMKLVKWIIDLGGINIHINDDECFQQVCRSGNVELAMYLLELAKENGTTIDIHSDNDSAFENACRYNRLEMAIWLWDFVISLDDKIDLEEIDRDLLMDACEDDHLEIFKYLFNLYTQEEIEIQDECLDVYKENARIREFLENI